MRKNVLCGLLALVICTGCSSATPTQKPAEDTAGKTVSPWDRRDALVLPFDYDFSKATSPSVWVRFNGGAPLRFAVDTGSSPSLTIWDDAASRLRLKPQNKWRMRGGGTASDFRVASVSLPCLPTKRNAETAFYLSNVEGVILKSPYAAWKPDPSRPVGLIGNALLRRLGHAVRFDFVARELTIYRRMTPPAPVSASTNIPIHKADGVYAVDAPLPDGGVQEMLIDTGCEGYVYIPQRLARRFHTNEWENDGGTFTDANGDHPAIDSLMPALQIGKFVEKDVLTTQGQSGDNFSLLGIDYLSRFRVTLDYAQNTLTLERAADYERHLYKP